jgi:hypothetical protein
MDLGRLQLALTQLLLPPNRNLLEQELICKKLKTDYELGIRYENQMKKSMFLPYPTSQFFPQNNFYASLFAFKPILKTEEVQSTQSTSPAFNNHKVIIPMKQEEEEDDSQSPELESVSKQQIKGSASKNYIALLCTGFARTILGAEDDSDIWTKISQIVKEKRKKFKSIEKTDEELSEFIKEQIYRDFCGKRVKKSNRGRDFKVRNTEELAHLISIKDDDNDMTRLKKECFKELFTYFFNSKYYDEWLSKGMINKVNRSFFIVNKKELQKKFQNPSYYKPRFSHELAEDVLNKF